MGLLWGTGGFVSRSSTFAWLVPGVAALMVSVGGLVPLARTAGAALPSPVTGAFFDSEPGDYVGAGRQITFTTVTDPGNTASSGTVAFNLSGGADSFQVWMSAPSGSGPLVPGTYENAQRNSFKSAGHPGLEVSGDSRGCNVVAGRFVVDDVTYTAGGSLQSFSGRFEEHCEAGDSALFGAISYNSTAAYRTSSYSSSSLNIVSFDGKPASSNWTITNNGPSNLTPSGFTITGPEASEFAVTSNTCNGQLSVGGNCTVTVQYAPGSGFTANATLSFYDELSPQGSAGEPAGAGTGRDIALAGAENVPVASLSVDSVALPPQRVGTFGDPSTVTLTNTGTATLDISDIQTTGGNFLDFLGDTTCGTQLLPSNSCEIHVSAAPTKPGSRNSELEIVDNAPNSPQIVALSTTGTEGYYIVGRIGDSYPEGDAVAFGGQYPMFPPSPVVSISTTPDGDGYWLAMANGGVYNFGDAQSFGSPSSHPLNKPVVGMASTPDGGGYWLVASDGGVFTFGDARYFGSTGGIRLNMPVVGMASTPDGGGYWLVASDGGVFTFGDANFFGSTGGIRLNKPVVGMASTPDGRGYWLVASDGGIFTFGDAPFLGSIGAYGWSGIVGMAGTAPPLDAYLVAHATSVNGGARKIGLAPSSVS